MSPVAADSPAVASYLGILQGIISRMANNSASCKAWCITLVSAISVVVAEKGKPTYVWVAAIPIGMFFALDAYYLGLERAFRRSYNDLVAKLHDGSVRVDDLFVVSPGFRTNTANTLDAAKSASVALFYLSLAAMLAVVSRLVS